MIPIRELLSVQAKRVYLLQNKLNSFEIELGEEGFIIISNGFLQASDYLQIMLFLQMNVGTWNKIGIEIIIIPINKVKMKKNINKKY